MTGHMENFNWGFGGLFMLLFWGLIILGIVVLIKWLWPPSNNHTQQKTALEILQARYARGEIDREEYLHKKTDLENK